MNKVLLRYSIIASVIVAGLMAIFTPMTGNTISYSTGEILGYISILLSLSTVFIAVKTYRDDYGEGKISFGRAFSIGLLITVIAGTVYSLSFLVYFHFHPEIMDVFKAHYIEEIGKGLSEADKAQKIEEVTQQMQMYSNPIVMFFIGLLMEYSPVGLVVSLIAALIFKRK